MPDRITKRSCDYEPRPVRGGCLISWALAVISEFPPSHANLTHRPERRLHTARRETLLRRLNVWVTGAGFFPRGPHLRNAMTQNPLSARMCRFDSRSGHPIETAPRASHRFSSSISANRRHGVLGAASLPGAGGVAVVPETPGPCAARRAAPDRHYL